MTINEMRQEAAYESIQAEQNGNQLAANEWMMIWDSLRSSGLLDIYFEE
jgi:hypothetical protein